jgi:hypothetical protein
MGAVEGFMLLGLLVVSILIILAKDRQLKDPEDQTVVSIEQLQDVCLLGEGSVAVVLIRQSGGVYRDLGTFSDSNLALMAVKSSFRRAKIDSVSVDANAPDAFFLTRLHHSHKGAAEGKKLGGAQISLLGAPSN